MSSGLDRRAAAEYSALFDALFPICRSIAGQGLLESLEFFRQHMPLEVESVATGTQVFDWQVPPEWRIRSARLTGPDGGTIVDFADSNLHVVSFSKPVRAVLPLEALQAHLHSLPEQPDLVPYVNQAPYGEPQLGRRGLYPSVNGPQNWGHSDDSTMDHREILNSVLTLLSNADGSRDLIAVAERRGTAVQNLIPIAERLEAAGLLEFQAG